MAPTGKLSSTSTAASPSFSDIEGSILNEEVPGGFSPEDLTVFLVGQSRLKSSLHTKHCPAASLSAFSLSEIRGLLRLLRLEL